MSKELKTYKVTVVRSQYEYYEVEAQSEKEALEAYIDYSPYEEETISVSYEEAVEI